MSQSSALGEKETGFGNMQRCLCHSVGAWRVDSKFSDLAIDFESFQLNAKSMDQMQSD